jgi:DNA polymerase-3 subunit beta
MKLTIERDTLAPIAAKAAKIVNGNVIPILGCALLTSSKEGLSINATDMDRWAEYTVPAEISKYGSAVVDAVKLAAVLANLPSGTQVEIQHIGEVLTLRCGRATFRFACLDAKDFPAFPASKKTKALTVAGSELARVIRFCGPAVSSEQTRYYLCGLSLEYADGEVTATATDGDQLRSTKVACTSAEPFGPIIIPSCSLSLLAALADAGEIPLLISDRSIEARVAGHRFSSKLIDGTYPDWRGVVPEASDTAIEVDPDALRQAINRVAPLAGEDGKSHAICLRPQIGEPLIAGANGSLSGAIDSIDASINGQPGDLAFRSRYLLSAIDANANETLKIQAHGHATRIDGAEESGDIIVVMRLNQRFPDVAIMDAKDAA